MYITAAILPLVYMVVWKVLTGDFTPEVQSMVIGAVMGSGFGQLANFWLGSSAGSQRKTELADQKLPEDAQ
jgi:membrane protein DedA with SNARE-associated domain